MPLTQGQSTDRLPGDTSPDTQRVLARGKVTTTTGNVGGGVLYRQGYAIIDLAAYNFADLIPEAEVYLEYSPTSGGTGYLKLPYVNIDINLSVDGFLMPSNIYYYSLRRNIAKPTQYEGNSYTLALQIVHRSVTLGATATFHWQIKSTPAAPFETTTNSTSFSG